MSHQPDATDSAPRGPGPVGIWARCAGRWARWFGLAGLVLTGASQAAGVAPTARQALDARVHAIRQAMQEAQAVLPADANTGEAGDQPANPQAQWFNWPNWGNWNNWPNWGNWGNWFNR